MLTKIMLLFMLERGKYPRVADLMKHSCTLVRLKTNNLQLFRVINDRDRWCVCIKDEHHLTNIRIRIFIIFNRILKSASINTEFNLFS